MRFASAYYGMLIYLTVIFKPIIPVICDMYSHTFGEAIHLATVHAKYGSNHLEKALATTGENHSSNQKNTSTNETYTVHISSPESIAGSRLYTTLISIFFRRFDNLTTIFLSILVPPPKH